MSPARAKRAAVSLGLLVLMFIPSAAAHAGESGTGTILFAHPTTSAISVTEMQFFMGNRCGSSPLFQGLDAFVIDVGEARTGRVLKVSTQANGFGSPNINVAYWTQGCKFSELHGNRASPYYMEIPGDARWAVISATYGANINISWWVN